MCASLGCPTSWTATDNIVRRDGSSLSAHDFKEQFELPNTPVLLSGIVNQWPATRNWTVDRLIERCSDVMFEAGPATMTMSQYWTYATTTTEENPLYLFDHRFAQNVPSLVADFDVPSIFSEDFFSILGDDRPHYRWLIVGAPMSGSTFHIDPNGTSAWNACISGAKKWIMFPPGHPPPGVIPSNDGSEVTSPISLAEWSVTLHSCLAVRSFLYCLFRSLRVYCMTDLLLSHLHLWTPQFYHRRFMNFYPMCDELDVRPIECVARSGDLVFVPAGWWHCVLNLDAGGDGTPNIAITQNYVSRTNLTSVCRFLRERREQVSGCGSSGENLFERFTKALDLKYPGILKSIQDDDFCRSRKIVDTSDTTTWDRLVAPPNEEGFSFGF